MLGAIIGDIVGSPYEFASIKTKEFILFSPSCRPMDDSIMTIAVGCACVEADCDNEEEFKRTLIERMRKLGRMYRGASYGGMFVGVNSDSAKSRSERQNPGSRSTLGVMPINVKLPSHLTKLTRQKLRQCSSLRFG